MTLLLAAIRAADPAATPAVIAIRDIAPPVDVPWPLWLKVLLWMGAIFLVAVAVFSAYAIHRWWPRTPPPPPPSPRHVALAELEWLRGQVRSLDPHAFSFAVSSVLRRFIEGHFGVRALEQTSPEFLAVIAGSYRFSEGDRRLLAGFLERADAIKFGRLGADEAASEALLGSATAFVQGGRA